MLGYATEHVLSTHSASYMPDSAASLDALKGAYKYNFLLLIMIIILYVAIVSCSLSVGIIEQDSQPLPAPQWHASTKIHWYNQCFLACLICIDR